MRSPFFSGSTANDRERSRKRMEKLDALTENLAAPSSASYKFARPQTCSSNTAEYRRQNTRDPMSEAPQLLLSWNVDAPMNTRVFRAAFSRNLASRAPADFERDWLFNHEGQANSKTLATVRFFTGFNKNGPLVGMLGVGEDTCTRMTNSLIHILAGISPIVGNSAPNIKFSKVQWEPSYPQEYRLTKLVLRTKKLPKTKEALQRFHDNPLLLAEHIAPVVANGIMAQAEAIGMSIPDITADDVDVLSVAGLGAQPLDHKNNNRAMLPRVTEARIQLPLKLNGAWSVGPLLTYGNGRIQRCVVERNYRLESGLHVIPAAPRQEILAAEEMEAC